MANPSENIARDRAPYFRHARTMQRRAATASLIGSVIEWYDFSSSSAPLRLSYFPNCSFPTPRVARFLALHKRLHDFLT